MAGRTPRVDRVVFATKTCFQDYHYFLSGAFERKWKACEYPFDKKILFINNGVPDIEFPCKTIKVEPLIDETLDFFGLNRDSFKTDNGNGFWYSIEELVELYYLKDFDYLVHFSSDALMYPSGDWITPGLEILKNEPDVSIVSPLSEVNTWGDYDQFCSDQAYLIKISEFRNKIFDIPGVIKDYPDYGGDSFEHKIGKYLRTYNKKRRILNGFYYHHPQY